MTALLDANVLIALVMEEHIHHGPARAWTRANGDTFATCPSTQGSLIRFLLRGGQSAAAAGAVLAAFADSPRHEFWADTLPYGDVSLDGVVGHRQVTDAYLAELARSRKGRLATFDRGLAALHQDVAVLVPTS